MLIAALDRGRRRLRAEQGFTLVELLVVTVSAVVLIGGSVKLFTGVARGEPEARDRAAAVQEARTMVEAVTRELREGYGVEVAEPNRLVLLTYVKRTSCGGSPAETSIACRVSYECDAGVCTRSEGSPSGSFGTAVEVVRDIAPDPVFSYSPDASDPNYVAVRVVVPRIGGGGEDAITLEDGVALRNTVLEG